MKKALFVIIMAIFATAFSASAQDAKLITFDYSKSFRPNLLHIDFNGDSQYQSGEAIQAGDDIEIVFTFKHSDFGTAGNLNKVELSVNHTDGTGFTGTALLRDIMLFRKTAKDNKDEEIITAYDNFGEPIFSMQRNMYTSRGVLLINNPAFFEFDTF